MDVQKILNELYAERARIEDAILALELLREGAGKRRRGRPPKWLVEARRRLGSEGAEKAGG
jgi:hypothetical protein